MSKIKAEFQVKLIVVGDVGVGKTYITHVFGDKLDQVEHRQKATAGKNMHLAKYLIYIDRSRLYEKNCCEKQM